MGQDDILLRKSEMRARVIALRNAILPEERAARSEEICERAFLAVEQALCEPGNSVGELAPSRCPLVAVFSSLGSEVCLSRFETLALAAGFRLCYPAMVKDAGDDHADMRFYEVPAEVARCKEASFLAHPARSCSEADVLASGSAPVEPEDIDFILAPLVAFDERGGRLGYGGGNYDALLARRRKGVRAVAIAFAEQRVDEVPREAHDLPVDGVIFG